MKQILNALDVIGISKTHRKVFNKSKLGVHSLPTSKSSDLKDDLYTTLDYLINYFTNNEDIIWGNSVEEINNNSQKLDIFFKTILFCHKRGIYPPNLLKLITLFIEYNNILFFSNASYSKYQEATSIGLTLTADNKVLFDEYWKSRFYLDSVYSDLIYSKDYAQTFSKKFFKAFSFMMAHGSCKDQFLALIHRSQYHLFNGKIIVGLSMLGKAAALFPKIDNVNYKCFYIYHHAWMLIEKGSYALAEDKLKQFMKLQNKSKLSLGISLHCRNIMASLLARTGKYKKAQLIAECGLKQVGNFFSDTNNSIEAEYYITLARCEMHNNNYKSAEHKLIEAIRILKQAFGGECIDPSQAIATFILAKAYALQGMLDEAFQNYDNAIKMYSKFYDSKFNELNEFRVHINEAVELAVKNGKHLLAKKYSKLL